jgi:hypothetical protein
MRKGGTTSNLTLVFFLVEMAFSILLFFQFLFHLLCLHYHVASSGSTARGGTLTTERLHGGGPEEEHEHKREAVHGTVEVTIA